MAGPRRRGGLHLTSGIIYGRGGRSGPLSRERDRGGSAVAPLSNSFFLRQLCRVIKIE